MKRYLTVIFAIAICGSGPVHATPSSERLRGVVEKVAATSITLQPETGAPQVIAVDSATAYAVVHKASVSAILPNSYVGTAAKGSGADMTALEVVIFPAALRGAGEGHYPWDPLPDITKPSTQTATSMTNGSVSAISTPSRAASSMTNGNVQTVSTLPGGKQISVVYKGGKQIIWILPNTPVVILEPASFGALKPGMHVFVVAAEKSGKPTALRIIAGAKGVTPPM